MEKYTMKSLISLTLAWSYERNVIKGSDSKSQLNKLIEEIGELAEGINKKIDKKVKDGLGDMLVVMINIAEQQNLTLQECLEHAYTEIKDRKGIMIDGIFIKEEDLNKENHTSTKISENSI